MPKVVVKTTPQLSASLDPQELADIVDEFAFYKEDWPKNDDMFYYFGKDGGYTFPALTPPHQIQHVHMYPSQDAPESPAWEAAYRRTQNTKTATRKTSNRVLVYARDQHEYLLIFMLPEPDAHKMARGATPEHAAMMEKFRQISEAFIFNKRDLNGQPYL